MNEFLEAMKDEANLTFTENGAGALNSTKNAVLDAFGSMGAMQYVDVKRVVDVFKAAFAEDRALSMKLLFYIRDIRGGQGMRRVFRICLTWLALNFPEFVVKNLDNILFFGRGDDYLCLLDTDIKKDVITFLQKQICDDIEAMNKNKECSLLAKWLPSENASSKETKRYARMLIEGFKVNPKTYRKTLVELREYIKVVEQKMSARQWTDIDYEKVPAKASMIYSNAFYKHDEEGYRDFVLKLANGDSKINAGSLFPVDIVAKALTCRYNCSPKDRILLDAMWKALPNYLEGQIETGICVVDTSGSMYGKPIEVAISLGMYCADKCKGPFENHFITFSNKPALVEIKGNDIVEKVSNISDANWDMNTNLEAVFDLILDTAIKNNIAQEDLPAKLYIISDMQFDAARVDMWDAKPRPFMDSMREKYENVGYTMPTIIYWNVSASECGMFQETFEGENCAMVSGYSSSLFKSIIEGTEYEEEVVVKEDGTTETKVKAKVDPMTVMLTTLNNERYDRVVTEI